MSYTIIVSLKAKNNFIRAFRILRGGSLKISFQVIRKIIHLEPFGTVWK